MTAIIIEIFDCGHGHYSAHLHDVCQFCKQGKPIERYAQGDDGVFIKIGNDEK